MKRLLHFFIPALLPAVKDQMTTVSLSLSPPGMAGSCGSPFYALWVQRTNENPTAAKQPSAGRFSNKHNPAGA